MQPSIAILFGILSIAVATGFSRPSHRSKILGIVAFSFVFRLLLHAFVVRNLAFFSHGVAGGDCNIYENYGEIIATMWQMDGIQYVTADVLPDISRISLICNLYACIIYICGPGSSFACTALIAFLACLLCLVMYRFTLEMGASDRIAFGTFVITIFSPSFIYHTSDMYKDGINALLVVSTLYLGLSSAKRFSIIKLALIIPILWALWNVRPYMVFMCLVPLPLAFLGTQQTFSLRKTIGSLVLMGAMIAAVAYGASKSVISGAETQFAHGTNADARTYNSSQGGSSVVFDESSDSPWSAIGPKLAYTVFSPFPWTGGSIGLQLAKIDTLIWYYILFSAARAVQFMWRRDRQTLLMLLLFLVSGFLAYATTMANIGLIFRQRMPLVMVTTVLASVYWTHRERLTRRRPVVRAPLAEIAARPLT